MYIYIYIYILWAPRSDPALSAPSSPQKLRCLKGRPNMIIIIIIIIIIVLCCIITAMIIIIVIIAITIVITHVRKLSRLLFPTLKWRGWQNTVGSLVGMLWLLAWCFFYTSGCFGTNVPPSFPQPLRHGHPQDQIRLKTALRLK